MPYLAYEEAGIVTVLSLTSFLLLLNSIRYILDQILYCGLIGEILIGIIWGLPVGGTAWLSEGTQQTIQAFGYLGLLGLVFEGGLSTDPGQLRKNAMLSVTIATVGLLMPIALSFILIALPFSTSAGTAHPKPLAAFSAGASLCSTSLGTTFAVLSSAGLQKTRAGVVLTGAAIMDDIVGLVMVNIITTLGAGSSDAWTIARPIVASFGLLIVVFIITPYFLLPLWGFLVKYTHGGIDTASQKPNIIRYLLQVVSSIPHFGFIMSILLLILFVTIASYIDASVLFASFLAGAVLNSLWGTGRETTTTPSIMYERYYQPVLEYLLIPFFFASIGFSIPITEMFRGSILWKGIVYALLMLIAKLCVSIVIYIEYLLQPGTTSRKSPATDMQLRDRTADGQDADGSATNVVSSLPHSVALLVGFAMVSRGEIGFLIASLSQSSGTLVLRTTNTDFNSEDIFLVIVWAVVICTIVGPIAVGVIVRRLRHREVNPLLHW